MNTAQSDPGNDSIPLRCVDCDYDLTGLVGIKACPECSCPTERTLRGRHLLRAQSSEWLAMVIRGMRALELASWLLFGFGVALLLSIVLERIVGTHLSWIAGPVGDVAYLIWGTAFVTSHVWGSWRMSTPNRGGRLVTGSAGQILRWSGVAFAPTAGTVMLLHIGDGWPLWAMHCRAAVLQGLALAYLWGFWRTIAQLHMGTRDSKFDKSVSGLKKTWIGLATLVVLFGWVFPITPRSGLPGDGTMCWVLIFFMLSVGTLRRVRREVEWERQVSLAKDEEASSRSGSSQKASE